MRNGDLLSVLSATPYEGWTSEVRIDSGHEVLGYFWSETLGFEFAVALNDGAVSYQLEPIVIEPLAVAPSTSAEVQVSRTTPPTTSPPVISTTTTTLPPTTSTASTTTTLPTTTTTLPTTTTTLPTTTTTAPELSAWIQVPVDSPGGSIVISHRSGRVRLESATPAAGFVVEDVEERRSRVEVTFEGDDVSYRLRAEWKGGALIIDVDEDRDGDD